MKLPKIIRHAYYMGTGLGVVVTVFMFPLLKSIFKTDVNTAFVIGVAGFVILAYNAVEFVKLRRKQ